MNNKGFTLVELLAVIIILSLLAVLASSSVTNVVKNSKSDLYNAQLELIKSAAEAWGADNLNKLPDSGACKYLTLRNLKEYGLLEPSIKNPKTNTEFSDNLKIKISSETTDYGSLNVTYEVDSKNISTCENVYPTICTAVTEETKTTGNIPAGSYEVGDEYICEVKDNVSYNFFVLSTDEEKVNLIMDSNINALGEAIKDTNATDKGLTSWASEVDYGCGVLASACSQSNKGPLTAINYLNTAISSWTNIENLNHIYNDENERYTNFELRGKARLPKLSEISKTGCDVETFAANTCPLWIVNYMSNATAYEGRTEISGINGYWILPSSDVSNSWTIYYDGKIYSDTVYISVSYGIRPVITVPKYNIS